MVLQRGVALFLCVSGLLFAQKKGEPVPTDWIHEGRLVVPESKFSVASPKADSPWTHMALPDIQGSKATAFMADASPDETFMVIVWENGGKPDSGTTKQFVDGLKKTLPKDWIIEGAQFTPSSVPFLDSSKFKVVLRLPNGVVLYMYGYAAALHRTYMFIDYSTESEEPQKFSSFVSSFKVIETPTTTKDLWIMGALIGGVLLVQGAIIWVSSKAKPLSGKPYRWGTYVGITTGLVALTFSSLIFSGSDSYGREAATVMTVSAFACSVGLLRRQKFGVVMFVITCVVLVLFSPWLDAMRGTQPSPAQSGQGIPVLLYLGITTSYFVKRWKLMGKPKTLDQPPPLPI
jgi:hypothetical protein